MTLPFQGDTFHYVPSSVMIDAVRSLVPIQSGQVWMKKISKRNFILYEQSTKCSEVACGRSINDSPG